MKMIFLPKARRFIIGWSLLLFIPYATAQTAPVAVVQTATSVRKIAFSPDGKWIATVDEPGLMPALWEVQTGHKILALQRARFPLKTTNSIGQTSETLSGAPTEDNVLALSPDGTLLAAIPPMPDASTPPVVWSLPDGEPIGPWNRDSSGHLTLTGTNWTDSDIRDWYFGRQRRLPPPFNKANAISADGSLAAISTGTKEIPTIEVWDVKANREFVSIPVAGKTNTSNVAFSPNGSMLAVVNGKGADIWKLKPLTKLTTVGLSVWAYGVHFSADGQYLALFGSTELRVMHVGTWTTALEYDAPGGEAIFTDVAISRDSRFVAAASGGLDVWDLQTGNQKIHFAAPMPRVISALAASADGNALAVAVGTIRRGVAERDSTIELWPLYGAAPPRVFAARLYRIQSLGFSHDSQWLAAATQDDSTTGRYTDTLVGEVRLWHVAEGLETKLSLKGEKARHEEWSATNIAFSRDNKQLVADVFTEGNLPPSHCDPDAPCGDAETLPYDVRTTFLDVVRGREVNSTPLGTAESSPDTRRSFWLSPDGRRAFALEGKLIYIDTLTGRKLRTFQAPQITPEPGGTDYCDATGLHAFGFVAFASDLQQLAISDSRSLVILDSRTGASKTNGPAWISNDLASLDYAPLAGAFSPDGRTLAVSTCSGSQSDGELRLYRSDNLELSAKTHIDRAASSIVFTAQGSLFLSGGSDGTVRLWNARNTSLVATLIRTAEGEWIVFTPDGLYDASTNGADLLAWRMHDRLVMAADIPQMRVAGLLSKLVSGVLPRPAAPLATVFDTRKKDEQGARLNPE